MSAFGVDYAFSPHPPVSALKKAGVVFVCRYISQLVINDTNGKNLLPGECKTLLAANIKVCVVVEEGATRMKGGRLAGVNDARHADTVTKALKMPGIPIYFACDYDAPQSDQGAINGYLDGAASVIGRSRTGMYGGYWPLSRARAAGKASYFWGTIAWSGANWANHTWWDIMQGLQVGVGGVSVDIDHAKGKDYGQWPRPAADPPPPPGGPPYRHLAKWTDTPASIAAKRNTTVEHLLETTAAAYTDADKKIAANKRLRSGMPYYTSNL